MEAQLAYNFLEYGIPVGIYVCICFLLWIVGYRARWYIVLSIVGFRMERGDARKATKTNLCSSGKVGPNQQIHQIESIETKDKIKVFFNIEEEAVSSEEFSNMHRGLKLLSLLYTSAILGVFMAIIFEKCILSFKRVKVGEQCPFDSECFCEFGSECYYRGIGPFNCTKDEILNSPLTANYTALTCFRWVYVDQDAESVLDAIGINGGLLGIVSSVVPLVYYVCTSVNWWLKEHFQNNKCCLCWNKTYVILAIIIPSAPLFGFIWIMATLHRKAPPMTALFICALLFVMISPVWVWGAYVVFRCQWGTNFCRRCDRIKLSCRCAKCRMVCV